MFSSYRGVIAASGGGLWAQWDGTRDGTREDGQQLQSGHIEVVKVNASKIAVFGFLSNVLQCYLYSVSGETLTFLGSDSENIGTPGKLSASLLTTNKIILSADQSKKIVVIDASASTPVIGTPYSIGYNMGFVDPLTVLDASRAFITYRKASGSDTYAMVLSISGTTITGNTEGIVITGIDTDCTSCYVDTDKVCIAYKGSGTSYPTAKIVNVSSTSISTLGTEKTLESFSIAGGGIDLQAINSANIIALYGPSSGTLKAQVLSISGNTIDTNSPATVDSEFYEFKLFDLGGTTEFMAIFGKITDIGMVYGRVLTLSGANINTPSAKVEIDDMGSDYTNPPKGCSLTSNTAVVAYTRYDGSNQNATLKVLQP